VSVPVFVTVDTEEDNWGDYACRRPTVTNLRRLPTLQDMCQRHGAIPTYLVNWPAVTNPDGRAILRELVLQGGSEIGAHCHPWNTPPVSEDIGPRNSLLSNLAGGLVAAKLATLHRAIGESLAVEPVTFRAGRWGLGPEVTSALAQLGYRVDTSVTPFIDWSAEAGPDFSRAPSWAYRFDPVAPLIPTNSGSMMEIPATVGFWQANQARAARWDRWARTRAPRSLHAVGLLDRLGAVNRRWLSPEVSRAGDMIRLARRLVEVGISHLNVSFHSVTLEPGRTPFVRTDADRVRFLGELETFLAFAREAGFRFSPLSSGPALLRSAEGPNREMAAP